MLNLMVMVVVAGAPERAPLDVLVVDETGRPVSGARVGTDGPPVPTGPDGHARVRCSVGRVELSAFADGFVPTSAVVGAEATTATIRLPRGPVFHGVVHDSEGKPVAGVEVMAGSATTLTAPDGSWRAVSQLVGKQTLSCRDRSRERSWECLPREVDAPAGSEHRVDFAAHRLDATLLVTVVGGSPSDIDVTIERDGKALPTFASTAGPRYDVSFPSGRVTVTVRRASTRTPRLAETLVVKPNERLERSVRR